MLFSQQIQKAENLTKVVLLGKVSGEYEGLGAVDQIFPHPCTHSKRHTHRSTSPAFWSEHSNVDKWLPSVNRRWLGCQWWMLQTKPEAKQQTWPAQSDRHCGLASYISTHEHTPWLSFTRPSPVLVLQVTNTGWEGLGTRLYIYTMQECYLHKPEDIHTSVRNNGRSSNKIRSFCSCDRTRVAMSGQDVQSRWSCW